MKKKRKLNAKERELKAQWEKSLVQWSKPLERGAKAKAVKATSVLSNKPNIFIPEDRNPRAIKSVDTGKGYAAKKQAQQYSGDKMIGIGQLHKSNQVPVFSTDEAQDIAKMRRG